MCSQDDSPVVEAGLFTVRQTAWPEDQLDVFATYRAARVLNVVTPPVLCSVGVIGNVMTLLVLTCSALRTNACCRYLAALALCDIAVLLLNFCFGFVDAFLYTLLSSDVACKLYYFLFFTCAHLSAWLLVAVTAQRCYVVCRPMTSLTVTSKRCTAYVIGGLTAASVGLNFHHLVIRQLVWSERTGSYMCHTGPGTRDVFVHRVWPWIDSTVYCFLPSPCLVVLNFLLVRALRRAAVFRRSLQCHNRQEKPKRGTCVSTVIRDNAKPQSDVNGSKQASGKLFVCSKVSEPSSRILRSVVVPRTDNPLASAWNADTATPEPNSEGDNFSQRKNWQVRHSIVGCKRENTKLGLKRIGGRRPNAVWW
ncbi:uncharacterized protein LOC143292573 [Babylonia areolata]|uniref:uncharacterized protein LOC143292573 n=1 Tax=Babylonia areolata TaxID=304850 RepID=UPI003FD32F02